MAETVIFRRTEAKAYFANERTFLHWLNIAVTVGSISAAMLGVSGHVHKHWGSDFTKSAMAARLLALLMMLTSMYIAAHATWTFARRSSLLKFKQDSGYENKVLPIVTTIALIFVLGSVFSGAVETYHKGGSQPEPPAPPAEPPLPPHHIPVPPSAAPSAAELAGWMRTAGQQPGNIQAFDLDKLQTWEA